MKKDDPVTALGALAVWLVCLATACLVALLAMKGPIPPKAGPGEGLEDRAFAQWAAQAQLMPADGGGQ